MLIIRVLNNQGKKGYNDIIIHLENNECNNFQDIWYFWVHLIHHQTYLVFRGRNIIKYNSTIYMIYDELVNIEKRGG